jgi:hypothetical protein
MCQIAKSMRFALITLSLLLSAFLNAHAALNLSDLIPIGPQVKVGKLDNGCGRRDEHAEIWPVWKY